MASGGAGKSFELSAPSTILGSMVLLPDFGESFNFRFDVSDLQPLDRHCEIRRIFLQCWYGGRKQARMFGGASR